MNLDKYVLSTPEKNYYVGNFRDNLVLGDSISKAMIFDPLEIAEKFKSTLSCRYHLECTIEKLDKLYK